MGTPKMKNNKSMLKLLIKNSSHTGLLTSYQGYYENDNNHHTASIFIDVWKFEDKTEKYIDVWLYGDNLVGFDRSVKVKDYKSAKNLVKMWLNVI